MTVTRPQRPCRQPHGTVARYSAGCSCIHCCDAWSGYQQVRNAEIREGLTRIVDAAPVREHIRWLVSRGWRMRAIAEQSLVSFTTVHDVLDGRRPRVRREIAEAILTLGPTALPTESTALVPAHATHRLLKRLYQRHGPTAVARAMGITRGSLPRPSQTCVQARTAKRVREAAELLKEVTPMHGGSEKVGG